MFCDVWTLEWECCTFWKNDGYSFKSTNTIKSMALIHQNKGEKHVCLSHRVWYLNIQLRMFINLKNKQICKFLFELGVNLCLSIKSKVRILVSLSYILRYLNILKFRSFIISETSKITILKISKMHLNQCIQLNVLWLIINMFANHQIHSILIETTSLFSSDFFFSH